MPVDFLLKQVDYLTERHASQVRAQVRKATAAAKGGSSAASPVPGSDSAAGIRSIRRDSHAPRYEGSGPGTPLHASVRPAVSRNASGATAVIRDTGAWASSPASSGRIPSGTRGGDQTRRRGLSSLAVKSSTERPSPPAGESDPRSNTNQEDPERSLSPEPAAPSSTTTSEDESSPAQSRIIRRPPRTQNHESTNAYADDEDDESEPAFQPYKPPTGSGQASAQDLGSTLRGDARPSAFKRPARALGRDQRVHHSQTSDSDTGSTTGPSSRPLKPQDTRAAGPLSPRRTAELAGRSPGGKGSREGSDGTPSMGSSYSDLDGMLLLFIPCRSEISQR